MSKRSYSSQAEAEASCSRLSIDADAVERVRLSLSDKDLLDATAALYSAMGDPTRLRMLEALAREELCVCDLAQLSGISQSGVSHQLRLLRGLGLVAFRRDGNRAVYRLADDHVRSLLAQGFEHAAEGWER
jgi:ArsR family transcriptional regulator, lead/cadmium/zinc/bismuth-responsive transcriptional repressor